MRIKYISINPVQLLAEGILRDVVENDILEVSDTVASHLLSTNDNGDLISNHTWEIVEEVE